MVTSFEKK